VLHFMKAWVRTPQDKVTNLIVHKERWGGDAEGLRGLFRVIQVSGIKLESAFPLSQPSFSKTKLPIPAENDLTHLKTNTDSC